MFLILVALAGSTALAVGVMLIVRRFAPPDGFLRDSVPAAGVFGVLGVAFAVIRRSCVPRVRGLHACLGRRVA